MSHVGRRLIDLHGLRDELVAAQDAVEELVESYGVTGEAAAEAEAGYKRGFALEMVRLADEGGRMPVAEREARAQVVAGGLLRVWLLAKAEHDAVRQGLLAARARQDTLRTLSASERALLT